MDNKPKIGLEWVPEAYKLEYTPQAAAVRNNNSTDSERSTRHIALPPNKKKIHLKKH
nr:hypothetical protein [uncultured Mucilaginibacter sp.]